MQVSVHGTLHKQLGILNQDACRELKTKVKVGDKEVTKRVGIVCDGCTNIDPNDPKSFLQTHNEVGAGLFCSLYEALEDPFDAENFPKNAEMIMEKMLGLVNFSEEMGNKDCKENKFVLQNYIFTILAVFETEDSFVVYFLGDGIILAINHFNVITYIEKKNGNCPPYLINNYLLDETGAIPEKVAFEKFVFPKKDFKNVGIASDGLKPIVRRENFTEDEMLDYLKNEVDKIFTSGSTSFLFGPVQELKDFINDKPAFFADDTTVVW